MEVPPVGGLVAIGLEVGPDGDELLLIVSHSGRSVMTAAGERLARDYDESGQWYDACRLEVRGIGPLEGRVVRVAGLHGGGLLRTTHDGWIVDVVCPDWPLERVTLTPPRGQGETSYFHESTVVLDDPITEVRAVGFSVSGTLLVVAASDSLLLWRRDRVAAPKSHSSSSSAPFARSDQKGT